MATTTSPIDVERYLLQGEGNDPSLDVRTYLKPIPSTGSAAPTKPSLNDALLQHYNATADKPLAPGELPPPVTPIPEPARPSLLDRAKQYIPELPPMGTGDPTTQLRPLETKPPDPRLYTSKQALHQRRLNELPSRSRGLLADLGEAAYTITRDIVGAGFGALTAASDILNAQVARIARGGPMAGGPESPTHYRDIFKEMNKTISAVRYEPQSDIAKMAQKAVGGAAGIVSDLSELVTKPIAYLTGLDEDRAKVLSYAIELWAFSKLDAGVRRATSGVRSKLADFSDRMSKMKSDADYTSSGAERAAQDLYTVVNRNPDAQRLITEARQKLIGEAGKVPPEGGPAPGGAKVDPAELQAYKDTLRTRADELRKQGAGPTRIQNELNAIPKPQPKAAGETPVTERPAQPEVVVGQETALAPRTPEAPRPTAEPVRPTPEQIRTAVLQPQQPTPSQLATPLLAPIPTQEQIVRPEAAATVPTETAPAPVSEPTATVAAVPMARTEPVTTLEPSSTARNLYDAVNNPDAPTTERNQNLAQLKVLAKDSGKTIRAGLEQLGFTPNEVSTLETQLRTVRAKKAGTETLQQVAEATQLVPGIPNDVYDFLAREGDATVQAISRRAGLTYPEVNEAIRQLQNEGRIEPVQVGNFTRYRAKPAVQTAATEASLDAVPAGTEVEIASPSEPVIDSTPIIDKPKRTRKIVKAPEAGAPEPPPRIPADLIQYHNVPNINALTDYVGKIPETLGVTNIPQAPLYVRAKQGEKPDAIFVDTARLNTRTSLADIQAQIERGRMSTDVGAVTRANLERQAALFERPIAEAHQFTGQELMREATRIAAQNDLDLYVKKGKNYELVPKDVVRTDAKLNSGDDLAPVAISKEAAGAYVESKTAPIGPDTIREIENAIETGVDISEKLPAELVPHYREMRARERDGIDTSERRAFMDILSDFNTMLGEQGAFGGDWSRKQRMAAQRLQADMRKAGKDVREFLFGARPEDVAVFERYLERINNPPPVDSTNPRNMRFDPTIPKSRGDRVVKQRKVSGELDLDAVPLWQSEVSGIQNARDIKAGGTHWDLKLPLRQHKAAGTEFIYYAYRTAQKNKNAALNDLHADMQELSRGFSSNSLEAIGANGYQRQGGDGQRILTYNKVTPRALTPAERNLQATIDRIYEAIFEQLQESRAATGRAPLQRVDDYQTFARTIGLLNHLGIKVDLARDDPAIINETYIKHRATNFPYIVRKHAFYTAEFNALKILDRYMQSALSDIYMSPFLAKVHELIETKLPDPKTGKETWMLKDNKPGLYNELRTWTDYISTGTNLRIPDKYRVILNTLNSNVAYAALSGLIRSGGIQISTLVNTQHALGSVNTAKAMLDNMLDHVTGGKRRQFALDNSEILSSRKFIDAYNEVAGAIIGRRPRDFFHAIRTGAWGDLQQAVGKPGFKLMELMDMEAAATAWNGAYKQATNKLKFNHKEAVRYADDLVVRTQGSTMPGDLSGVQRNALGKLITQFQTFLISDWNFLTHEVLTKGKPGGGGGGQIPPGGGVASGSGNWEVPGSRSTFQLVKNIVGFLIATQLMNEFFKLIHLQPAQPDPLKDIQQGLTAGHGPIGLVIDLAVGQAERMPVYGGALRYGKGITGPATETARDLVRAARGDPLTRNPYENFYRGFGMSKGEAQLASRITEPLGTMIGVPYMRQLSKTFLGLRRGENVYDSLMGWYSEPKGSSGRERRERGETRERRTR